MSHAVLRTSLFSPYQRDALDMPRGYEIDTAKLGLRKYGEASRLIMGLLSRPLFQILRFWRWSKFWGPLYCPLRQQVYVPSDFCSKSAIKANIANLLLSASIPKRQKVFGVKIQAVLDALPIRIFRFPYAVRCFRQVAFIS